MAGEKRYEVVFCGLTEGADPGAVRERLARLFNTDAARIDKLLAGPRAVIKRGLDEAGARNYQAVLGKAGARVEVRATAAAARPETASIPTAAPDRPAPAATGGDAPAAEARPATAAPAGRAADAPPRAPDFDVAEPGALLVEPVPVEEPDIDISHLSMAEVGATLVEPAPVEEPRFDLSGLTLDPPGTALSQAPPVAPAEYDVSRLALDDP